jgi:hypothetical protein
MLKRKFNIENKTTDAWEMPYRMSGMLLGI